MRYFSSTRFLVVLLITTFGLSLYPALSFGQQNIKIGYVNLQNALTSSATGKRATETLKKERQELIAQLKQKEEELEVMKEQITKQASVLNEAALKEKQEQFREKAKDYDRFKTDAAESWERRKTEWEQKIIAEIIKVIQELGKKKQYTIIFAQEQGILYASEAVDLTNEVIAGYDSQQK